MPQFELTTADRKRAESLLEFVKREYWNMPVNSRFVFCIEMSKHMKPEIDELKRKAQEGTP